jgi:hypothetical protein
LEDQVSPTIAFIRGPIGILPLPPEMWFQHPHLRDIHHRQVSHCEERKKCLELDATYGNQHKVLGAVKCETNYVLEVDTGAESGLAGYEKEQGLIGATTKRWLNRWLDLHSSIGLMVFKKVPYTHARIERMKQRILWPDTFVFSTHGLRADCLQLRLVTSVTGSHSQVSVVCRQGVGER